jgi:hypothetical protein
MKSAELKQKLFQILDSQDEAVLLELYNIFSEIHIHSEKKLSDNLRLELNYLAMSLDIERENAAQDWIENTSNFEDL